ncbi:TetR family transcriptional regulator [Knoellia locipacati]|uniref:TetR family transcriptional regulator n=1 Tax=Knoellia locipacati TaxID=882824 RepID=A0A512T0Y0_9MICO|nr:TetR family transcriptional regulator [Knoellia locipacati]GEQ13851.1 TetR family transcriptional regulator [Knoellia locipacati]
MSPRGRRPGGEDTRAAIVTAARTEFAQRGYDGTSLRGVAREAGVDPKLVHHYFDGKSELFVEVMAFPANPAVLVEQIAAAPRDALGETLARVFLAVWDGPEGRERFAAMFAAAAAHEEHARMVREFVGREVLHRVVESMHADPDVGPRQKEALEVRVALGAAQLIGMGLLRYVVKVPAVADASVDELVAILGPTLQHHLVPPSPH